MRKSIIILLILIGCATQFTPEVNPKLEIDAYQSMLEPSVRISASFELDNKIFQAGGSGIAIGNKDNCTYILTAYHVVDIPKTANNTIINVAFFYYKEITIVRAEIIDIDYSNDLALLKVKGLFPIAKVGATLRIFQKVYAIGCRIGNRPSVSEGIVSCEIFNANRWTSSAPAIHGCSGGGIFLQETGELIGIMIKLSFITIASPFGIDSSPVCHIVTFVPITIIREFFRITNNEWIIEN